MTMTAVLFVHLESHSLLVQDAYAHHRLRGCSLYSHLAAIRYHAAGIYDSSMLLRFFLKV